ncbi:MAG: hypothetical protein AAFW46_15280, partial [Pseudomonadota bacterium]
MAAVLLHDTIDAELGSAARETMLTELGETLGEISLYGLLILVTITFISFVPYHLWRWTHRLMGAFFAFSAIHYMLILKPFGLFDPLGLYVLSFCVLGLVCYAITLIPAERKLGSHTYQVADLAPTANALSITLTPEGAGLRHRPGQFAFVRFDGPNLEESRPFTISKAPTPDRALRFTVRTLGDGTARYPAGLTTGMRAIVSGPFGRFEPPTSDRPQLWIAGGVGVTPLAAWAEALSETAAPVDLVVSVRIAAELPLRAELEALAASKPNLRLHIHESGAKGRLTAEAALALTEADPKSLHVAFCGPKAMRNALRDGLVAAGLPKSRFHFEEFEIRTTVELRLWLTAALDWVRRVSGSRAART